VGRAMVGVSFGGSAEAMIWRLASVRNAQRYILKLFFSSCMADACSHWSAPKHKSLEQLLNTSSLTTHIFPSAKFLVIPLLEGQPNDNVRSFFGSSEHISAC